MGDLGRRRPQSRPPGVDNIALVDGWVDQASGAPDNRAAAIAGFFEHATETIIGFDGVGETLATLHGRGYRIGILSHVAWPEDACRAWFERRGWADHIDFYSLSSTVGWIKLNRKHYEHTIDGAQRPRTRSCTSATTRCETSPAPRAWACAPRSSTPKASTTPRLGDLRRRSGDRPRAGAARASAGRAGAKAETIRASEGGGWSRRSRKRAMRAWAHHEAELAVDVLVGARRVFPAVVGGHRILLRRQPLPG